MPNQPDAIAIAAVVLPVVALCLRLYAGTRLIGSNACGSKTRLCQRFFLWVGIVLLFFLDAFFIACQMAPPGVPIAQPEEWLIIGLLLATYWLLMIIAMYPGRSSS
jgi:hypothetical protein